MCLGCEEIHWRKEGCDFDLVLRKLWFSCVVLECEEIDWGKEGGILVC
jgi:hypothetical protein